MSHHKARPSYFSTVIVIILAGELIFALPFHLARFFRPTFLQAFDLSNTQLGDIFAVYGVVAMLSYFPGGIIADRFAPHRLMSFSLIATALGGMYLWTGPGQTGLRFLFGYWGATTILLFWAAMIKATRLAAGENQQGKAFGLLDAGRGLVASVTASGALLLMGGGVIEDLELVTQNNALSALRPLIVFYSGLTLTAAGLVYWKLATDRQEVSLPTNVYSWKIREILSNSLIWLQGGVVICAYCGFKALDNYGLFLVEVYDWSQIEAAEFMTYGSYLRPVTAIAAGLLADRLNSSRVTVITFILLAVLFALITVYGQSVMAIALLSATLLLTFVGVFALRAIYFALIEESQIDAKATGTAVGVISVLGFTPDIFFAPVTGRILDAGGEGFTYYFLFLSAMMLVGCLCAWGLITRLNRTRAKQKESPSSINLS